MNEARAWTTVFVKWYNNVHKHNGLKFVTPAQRHSGTDAEVLRQRERAYAEASAQTGTLVRRDAELEGSKGSMAES